MRCGATAAGDFTMDNPIVVALNSGMMHRVGKPREPTAAPMPH